MLTGVSSRQCQCFVDSLFEEDVQFLVQFLLQIPKHSRQRHRAVCWRAARYRENATGFVTTTLQFSAFVICTRIQFLVIFIPTSRILASIINYKVWSCTSNLTIQQHLLLCSNSIWLRVLWAIVNHVHDIYYFICAFKWNWNNGAKNISQNYVQYVEKIMFRETVVCWMQTIWLCNWHKGDVFSF